MNSSSDTALSDAHPSHLGLGKAGSPESQSEKGFTLVEVMVVVLIIGILLSIGVPTFLGARSRAQDRAAQASLRTAQNTALIIYTDNADFAEATIDNMSKAEPQVIWLKETTASTDTNDVSIAAPSAGGEFGAASMSDSGTCFYIHVRSDGSTQYGSSDTVACTGTSALEVKDPGW